MFDISHDSIAREARADSEPLEPNSHSGDRAAITEIFKADAP